MAAFAADLNELLVEIYRNIEILEESELKKSRLNLSISEMHMIELIAKAGGGMTVSEIAGRLKVTRPSVTVSVNKLVQKGYCEKRRRGRHPDGRGPKGGGVSRAVPPQYDPRNQRRSHGGRKGGAAPHNVAHQHLFQD